MTLGSVYNEDGLLIARDGRRIPTRIGGYLLDSPLNNGLDEHTILVGIDTISWLGSFSGGTVERGETLLDATLAEDREEAGPNRRPRIVHSRVLTFYNGGPELWDDCTLRVVWRSKTEVIASQQPAVNDRQYPEFLNPKYRTIDGTDAPMMTLRPCFCTAIIMAEQHNMLYGSSGYDDVPTDYGKLAEDWDRMLIHPDIIDYYCTDSVKPVPKSEEEVLDVYGEIINAQMKNLAYAEKGLDRLLRVPLPHDARIREQIRLGQAAARKVAAE